MNAPLRGRDDQLGMIREVLVGAVGGRGATLLVEGRPGFGKTRMLDAAADLAAGLGVRVGRGAVAARDATVPLGALFEAMFDGRQPLVDPAVRRRLHYLPEQRYWLLDELESLLEQAALRSSVLICLDDMQWAEVGCHAALRTLPTRLASLPIVWLVAYRPGRESAGLRPTVEGLVRDGARRCVLGPLDAVATGQVVRDVVQAEPDDALLSLARRTHGSPFLLGELLRGLREEGLVSVESGRARLAESRLPARVRDSMRERLARMSPGAAQLARVACVLGRTFSFDQLAAMLDTAPASLLDPIEELLGADLLSQDDDALTFRHDLLRDAVRDSLPATARRALQRQAVTVMLATGAAPVEVASALAASALPGDAAAVDTLRKAADALAGSDPGTAANLSRRALELAGDDDPARGPLAAQTVLLLHAAGRVSEGRAFAEEILGEALPPEQEAQVRLSLATMIALPPDTRIEAGRRALALPGLTAPVRARHLANLAHNMLVSGRAPEATQLLAEARAAVESCADPVATFVLATVDAGLDYYTADLEPLLRRAEQTVVHRAGASEPTHLTLAQQWRTELLAALDRHDECLRLISTHLARAHQDRQGLAVRIWENRRGRQLLQLGRLGDAAAALEGSLEPVGQLGQLGVLEAAAVVALGQIAIHTGDPALTRRCTDVVRDLDVTAAPGVRRHAAWLLALGAMATGDPSRARAHLCVLGEQARHTVVPRFPMDFTDEVSVVRIAIGAGDSDLVSSAVAATQTRARKNPRVASIMGAAAHARGLATGKLDDLVEAVRWYEQGPRPLALASALEDAGHTAAGLGQCDDGVAMLGRALETYVRLGASWDAGRARGRLRDLGVRRRIASAERPRHGWAALTDSELEVVRRVARGLTNREVAEQLFLSTHTVNAHLRHAFTKLGISSRMELVRLAAHHESAPG